MTPIEQAQALYAQQAPRRDFWSDLHQHLIHGHVFSGPTMFLMVFPVWIDRVTLPVLIRDADPEGDTWFVWLLCGDLHEALRTLERHSKDIECTSTARKKHIAFARRGVVRVWPVDRLLRHAPTVSPLLASF